MIKKQFLRFLLLLMLLAASLQIVSAQVTPAMSVYAVWTPDEQLTSVTGDDRYVDLQIYAQGNVPFWAVNLSCTIGNQTMLDFISLRFADAWGTEDVDFFYNPEGDALLYSPTGVLAFTATRLGASNTPLGRNGIGYTQLIATARFKVNNLSANTQAAVTCTLMDFIDRNGATTIRGIQTRLNNLMIYVGYSLTGVARRQGTTLNQNIKVTCGLWNLAGDNFAAVPNNPQSVFTSTTGGFRFGGATPASALRYFGLYRCNFESQFVQNTANQQVLLGYMDFELNTAVKNLLPVTLRTGDADGNGTVEFDDIISITGGFTAPLATPFSYSNDMNGDGRVTRLDIIYPAGNIGLSDGGLGGDGLLSEHVLYGIGRDYPTNLVFPNSRIWLGNPVSGDVSSFNTRSTTRDFWPMLSPDGNTIAYISQDRVTGRHKLAYLAASTGVITTTAFPASFTYDALAPSWSPDGNRVAFICAVSGAGGVNNGYLYNRGDICVVNAFDRTGAQINRLGVDSRIFPPTWLSYDTDAGLAGEQTGFVLLYGGADGDIHYYNFVTETHGLLTLATVTGTDVVDSPLIVDYAYNNNLYLAYRYNDGDATFDPVLRIGAISYDGTNFTGGATTALAADHVEVPGTAGVDYFDVSPTLDVMFYYEYNFAGTFYPAQDRFTLLTLEHVESAPLTWTGSTPHIPDSSVGNPTAIVDPDQHYNPLLPSNPTYLFAWRMTFDYVP